MLDCQHLSTSLAFVCLIIWLMIFKFQKKQSDIFALGCVIFEALTKCNPFGEKDYVIEENIRRENPPNFGALRNGDGA